MNTSALFGNSAWIAIGLGVALIVLGLTLKAKSGNSIFNIGSHNTMNQSIQINGGNGGGPPQGGSGWQSWLNVLGNICTVAGTVMTGWQSLRLIG
jgi:hypothetical protein